MIKKTITYKNLDGDEFSEDFYFNLSKAELAEMQLSKTGGMEEWLQRIVAAGDGATIISTFKELLRASVGTRSADGKSFIKTPEYADWFLGTDAYSALFMELVTDMDASTQFIAGIVPKDLAETALKGMQDVQLPEKDVQPHEKDVDDRPAWLRENREPTGKELREMPRDELILAMQRRQQPTSGG